ncbi:hypothetical protein DFQ29_008729 [Apophysomyces sp. BC1021]|nr:hypothetical protein DFQ29_008729 [Apophysomyces sp. BC1021]
MIRNKILVVGCPGVGKLDFVKSVLRTSNCEFPQQLVDADLEASGGKHSGLRIPWQIDTKYYTAQVDFWLDEVDGKEQPDVIKAYAETDNGIGQVVDAFVYVFSKDKPSTFDGIREWLPFLENCDPSIRLCIGTGANKKAEDAVEDWCIDNQIEYIDLDETTDMPLDKAGVSLAVDVLQTNMWDGLTQKTKVSGHSNSVDEDEQLLKELKDLSLQVDDQETNILQFSDDDGDGEIDLPNQEEIRQMQDKLFGDIDGEDGLDKAFETLQAMRGMDQGKNLPDEERRRLAAQVALSFAAQMGI